MRKLKKNQKSKNHINKKTTINDVPNEILMKIFFYINIIERQHLELVCKQWHSIIQKMWRSLRKLKYTERGPDNIYREHIANGFHLVSSNISHFAHVLKLYNGNLTKLEIEHADTTNKINRQIFSLLYENKNITTLKLDKVHPYLVIKYLKCFNHRNFKHLSITVSGSWLPPLLDFLEKALLFMTKLEYLKIPIMENWVPKSFTKFESIKSLRFDIMKIEKLIRNTELETLCTGFHKLNDEKLLQIVNNCKKLRHLDMFAGNLTEVSLRPLTNLPNLSHLNLPKITTIERGIFNRLSNLEYLRCTLSSTVTEHDLACFLERSPNLESFNFNNAEHNELFSAIALSACIKVRINNNRITRIDKQWTEIF